MKKFSVLFAFIFATLFSKTMAGPIEVEKSADNDLNTAETFGFGYYQPGLYSAPLVTAAAAPLAAPLPAASAFAAPVTTTLTSTGYARSGYNSGYKYGSNYGYGSRWGYGTGAGVNEFYRRHPIYVAWG